MPAKAPLAQGAERNFSPDGRIVGGRDQRAIMADPPILLFDGVCNLCNGLVRFVLKRESEPVLRFASLQSERGRQLLEQFGHPTEDLDTVVLVEGGLSYTKSDAALRTARFLRAPWSWARCCWIVPRPLRNWVYDRVANNRYRWFGRQEACMVPDPSVADRFLDA